ncbi:MAG TPA: hypothetical protein VLX28_07515 [Thermoanaerobaculia bacterium]|nr:hypothetical protein [Thermoanaerobaculia bacterium]
MPALLITSSTGIYTMTVANTPITATIGPVDEMRKLAAAMQTGWDAVEDIWLQINNTPVVSPEGEVAVNTQNVMPAEDFFGTTDSIQFSGVSIFETDATLLEDITGAGDALAAVLAALI